MCFLYVICLLTFLWDYFTGCLLFVSLHLAFSIRKKFSFVSLRFFVLGHNNLVSFGYICSGNLKNY